MSPNEKLNIACVGNGGVGMYDARSMRDAGENVVALCDVDDQRAAPAYKEFPKARKYKDFRKMLDEMGAQIDAVTISAPDHMHFPTLGGDRHHRRPGGTPAARRASRARSGTAQSVRQ
ncbi:Gfo/Idh/MocA family oxidoreductase [Pirellulales bacterium]|nr:Gfo/Idh/MocA family oxidoreductase [Pirellulales bacterium]